MVSIGKLICTAHGYSLLVIEMPIINIATKSAELAISSTIRDAKCQLIISPHKEALEWFEDEYS